MFVQRQSLNIVSVLLNVKERISTIHVKPTCIKKKKRYVFNYVKFIQHIQVWYLFLLFFFVFRNRLKVKSETIYNCMQVDSIGKDRGCTVQTWSQCFVCKCWCIDTFLFQKTCACWTFVEGERSEINFFSRQLVHAGFCERRKR